ncbi:MAG: sigma-70 family RNA polymerase sigma factor [Planctomycetes bacterium]|nr:sigma-70 family RNA polymerase sigma factor [Planctomycetota bacterium]
MRPSRHNPASGPSGHQVFEILVREHADMLTAFLRSLVRRQAVVDDLFQETMLVAWRRLADYDTDRPFGPWLRGIAVRLVLKHRQRSYRDFLNCEPAVLEALERRTHALDRLAGDSFRDRAGRLRRCLEKLPQRLRDVVELGYGHGLLLAQIADALDATEEAIKKRMQRARQMLHECLQARGGTA